MINKIIFYDGSDDELQDICDGINNYHYLEAGAGYKSGLNWLVYWMRKASTEDFSLITNSLHIWDNRTLRDLVNGDISKYYIHRDDKNIPIQELTDKEIRAEHNLEKMYVGGVFDLSTTITDTANRILNKHKDAFDKLSK